MHEVTDILPSLGLGFPSPTGVLVPHRPGTNLQGLEGDFRHRLRCLLDLSFHFGRERRRNGMQGRNETEWLDITDVLLMLDEMARPKLMGGRYVQHCARPPLTTQLSPSPHRRPSIPQTFTTDPSAIPISTKPVPHRIRSTGLPPAVFFVRSPTWITQVPSVRARRFCAGGSAAMRFGPFGCSTFFGRNR